MKLNKTYCHYYYTKFPRQSVINTMQPSFPVAWDLRCGPTRLSNRTPLFRNIYYVISLTEEVTVLLFDIFRVLASSSARSWNTPELFTDTACPSFSPRHMKSRGCL